MKIFCVIFSLNLWCPVIKFWYGISDDILKLMWNFHSEIFIQFSCWMPGISNETLLKIIQWYFHRIFVHYHGITQCYFHSTVIGCSTSHAVPVFLQWPDGDVTGQACWPPWRSCDRARCLPQPAVRGDKRCYPVVVREADCLPTSVVDGHRLLLCTRYVDLRIHISR